MVVYVFVLLFFKQKTAYEMRISDWSSDVCSSDLPGDRVRINIAGDEPFSAEVQIGSDGMIWLPRLGGVRAAGLRLPKLEEQIAVKLLDHYLDRKSVV